jgi:hypothetical protein
VWGFDFALAGGERDAVAFVSWYSNEGTWFREVVASKHRKKSLSSLSCHTAVAVAVVVVVVDVRKWTAPTSAQKNLQKKMNDIRDWRCWDLVDC